MLWMKRNAYEESTIRKVAKLLRHLKKNCNTREPEEVKLYIANKKCIEEDCILVCQANGKTFFKKPS
jgi:hypothetical protein